MRCCMCSIGVPAAAGVFLCWVCMFSLCWCWFPLGFSHNPKSYRTGELETVSECEYEYVCLSSLWWTGHLSRGVSCLWPRKGSSLMTIHRTSAMENVWNRWMDGCTVRLLVVPLSATLFSPTNVSSLIHIPKQNHSKAIHLSKDNQERKKERRRRRRRRWLKIGHLAWLSAEIAFSCVWNNYYSIL